MDFKKINNIGGWVTFAIALFVYLSTIEPTVSFWDCGEYIATSDRLEVGHPPGAPLFMMIGRVFTSFVDSSSAAMMVNALSGLCSALTILFLFWTITYFGRKIINRKGGEWTEGKTFGVIGAGLVGALAFTFSDSFWFSAVEGEVYAMSSFFTAVTFWSILKWEEAADEPQGNRWLVLIAYLIGLSIGVHLLNLLCIPAICFIYYFKKWETTTPKGFVITGIISLGVLVLVQNIIIPGIVSLSSSFEIFFVNTVGLPFNAGAIIYALLIISGIYFGLQYAHKKGRPMLALGLSSFAVLVIGYASFGMILVRSSADPPMDQNDPENTIRLLSYLNREQYGTWPLLNGQFWGTPLIDYDDGTPVYSKDETVGKYVITDDRKGSVPVYAPELMMTFPRLWRNEPAKVDAYKRWIDYKGEQVRWTNPRSGQLELRDKPTTGENMKFFFSYQINWMYWRYFMWNFAGRQNDIQGHGKITDGNWISGITPLDEGRLGPQELPEHMERNKARNKYYLLPLILGLLGLVFQLTRDTKNGFALLLLYLSTGFAIVIYLNQGPLEPRERDYAFAGSFYAFGAFIGLGALAVWDFLNDLMKKETASAIIATGLCLLLVPVVMAKENWDDHDRSERYTALAMARNYLGSCEKDAILFSMGDNDTFPLWYAQEVEGFRTDVRVVNLSYLGIDWYINQMKRKAYNSEPLPITTPTEKYRQGTRDFIPVGEDPKLKDRYTDVASLLAYVTNDAQKKKYGERLMNIMPTKKYRLSIDAATKKKLVANGTVSPELESQIVDNIDWSVSKNFLSKADLIMIDLLANFNWDRPIHFTTTIGTAGFFGLQNYFQLYGFTYRFVPVKATQRIPGLTGSIDTDILYENLMNKFEWGNIDNAPDMYLDYTNTRLIGNIRLYFTQLAEALAREGDNERALAVLDRIQEKLPANVIEYNYIGPQMANLYYQLGEKDKGNVLAKHLMDVGVSDMRYYLSFDASDASSIRQDLEIERTLLYRVIESAKSNMPEEEMSTYITAQAELEPLFQARMRELGPRPQ